MRGLQGTDFNGHKGTFGDDENIPYHDHGDGYTNVHLSKFLKLMIFLYLN